MIVQTHCHRPSRRLTSAISRGYESECRKNVNYQLCITLHEARLSGPDMDPCAGVQIGSHAKYTVECASTHRPVFNECFTFNFCEPRATFMDRIATITVYTSRKYLRRAEPLGTFKIDMATIYDQQSHEYKRRWAVLTDRTQQVFTVKGYVKCDMSVCAQDEPAAPKVSAGCDMWVRLLADRLRQTDDNGKFRLPTNADLSSVTVMPRMTT